MSRCHRGQLTLPLHFPCVSPSGFDYPRSMEPHKALALALDPSLILAAQGITPDPWQRELLLASAREILLNCCRQSGRSTTVAGLASRSAAIRIWLPKWVAGGEVASELE